MISPVSCLRCVVCRRAWSEEETTTTCPRCGPEGILDVELRRPLRWEPSGDRTIFRYWSLLPFAPTSRAFVPRLPVGSSPLVECPRLAQDLDVGSLWIKDEGRNPSGSFKDRASAVGVVKCRELGYERVACSSTGNAACSLAAFGADAGLATVIFVPERAPAAKLAQLRVLGARVLTVRGTYEEAYDLCEAAVEAFGWYDRNCAVNPFLVEGKKTCGLEIGEQMAAAPPDVVAVAVGDGCTVAGIWKGLVEMHELGVLPRLPRLLGVQAEGARALVDLFDGASPPGAGAPATDTFADSIAVRRPRNWRKAIAAVRASGGSMLAVPDEAIARAAHDAGRFTGVFVEPSAACALAGVREARARGLVTRDERVLYVATGSGLKDVQGAVRLAPEAISVGTNLADVERATR